MNFLYFLLAIGTTQLVFHYAWKWIAIIPLGSLFTLFKIKNWTKIIKLIGIYINTSLLGILAWNVINISDHRVIVIIIGAFFIFITYADNYYQVRREAAETADIDLIKKIQKENVFDFTMIFISVALYTFVVFFPVVGGNIVIVWAFYLISWINQLPVIGFIVGVGGLILIANFFLRFLQINLVLFGSIFHKK
jgi:hypothetical protein